MAQLGSGGTPLDLKLGQTSKIKNQSVNYEMQLVINSVQLLGQYLEVLRLDLEGSDSDDPSESLRFRRYANGIAAQDIAVGALCSFDGDLVYKGVGSTSSVNSVINSGSTIGSTGTRSMFGVDDSQVYVALNAASAGQSLRVGVPSGVIKLSGCKCGQILWGAGARSIQTQREANEVTEVLTARPFTGNGAIYLSNPISTYLFDSGGGYQWEGYWMPGFPNNSGGTYYYNRNFLYPIGVCILDGFALIAPRVYSPSPNPVIPA